MALDTEGLAWEWMHGPPHLSSIQEDCLGRWLQRDGARGHQESRGAQIKRAGGPILGGVLWFRLSAVAHLPSPPAQRLRSLPRG